MNVSYTRTLLLAASLGLSAVAAPVPAQLVGEWQSGSSSLSGYENLSTGAWQSASGSVFILKLAADGSYQYTGLMSVRTYSCESKVFSTERGQAVFSGNRLTLKPSSGQVQSYVCDPKNVKQGTVKGSEWTWSLGKDSGGKEVLSLGDPGGQSSPTLYTRQKAQAGGKSGSATTPASAPASPRSISGTVTAAGGHSLRGTVVVACPQNDCNSDGVRGVRIDEAGSSASFRLENLDDVAYAVYAVQDNDHNEDLNAGDWVDRTASQDQSPALLRPPASGLRLELVELR